MVGEKYIMLLLAAASLGGCSASSTWFGVPSSSTDAFVERTEPEGSQAAVRSIAEYLDVMDELLNGDPVRQAEAFRETSAAAEAWPTTTNMLRLALAVATPGHPWSDAAEARERLTRLLESGYMLRPEERTLARIRLIEVEQRLLLDEQARRAQNEAAQVLARQSSNNARQLEDALEENRRLREELADAQEKLEAITNIERSIRERESATDSP